MTEINHKLSTLSQNLASLSVSKLSEQIEHKKLVDGKILNFTLGDFNPTIFPIPRLLEEEIVRAYRKKFTNYTYVGGMEELRRAIAGHIKLRGDFNYTPEEIIVTSGTRPLIHLAFRTLVNPGEKILASIPSWNIEHFIYLAEAQAILIPTSPRNNFLITAEEIHPYLEEISLLLLNTPLNPTGSIFTPRQLAEICDMILEENNRRARKNLKPIYLLCDIIYWLLLFEGEFINPLILRPELREYIVFIDGISKCFAATGVRVGWAFGPRYIMEKMRSMLAHLGAWAPKAEQIATAHYLPQHDQVDHYLAGFKTALQQRLNIFAAVLGELGKLEPRLDFIKPQSALYLAIKIDCLGLTVKSQGTITDTDATMRYILDRAKLAIIPFHFFGLAKNSPWFRLSVGTCTLVEAEEAAQQLKSALLELYGY